MVFEINARPTLKFTEGHLKQNILRGGPVCDEISFNRVLPVPVKQTFLSNMFFVFGGFRANFQKKKKSNKRVFGRLEKVYVERSRIVE